MQADTQQVEQMIQRALADESATILCIGANNNPPPLTVNDARRIIACLRGNPRVDTLTIQYYSLHDDAVLNVFRDGLPLCTSITKVTLIRTKLTNEDLDRLRPAFYNTSVRTLRLISNNNIQGRRGGEVLRDLLVGNDTVRELYLHYHHFGPEVAIGFGRALTDNHGLQILNLEECKIGNDFLANLLLPADGKINNSLLELNLKNNSIQGEDGVRQVSLLLQRFSALKVLKIGKNDLGGAGALAPGLAAARHLETLELSYCALGNDGVANLILDGEVNRSLANLELNGNGIQGTDGGRQVSLLMLRFPQLKVLTLDSNNLGSLGACALAPGLAAARHLESLVLSSCGLGNDGVANLIPEGQVNRTLANLDLYRNGVKGADGGRQVSLLLQCIPTLNILRLNSNNLGNLGARELAPGLATASHLESLDLTRCGLANNGVVNLVPDGQVNRSLTNLNIRDNNIFRGGEKVVALVSRCINLDCIDLYGITLDPDQQRCLNLLLERKRLCTAASALGSSPFQALFRFVENVAHPHEHGLSAIFVILQNDGDDYFCTALDRTN